MFPREQFLILRSEDFFKDTPTVYAQVLAFLGLAAWQPRQFPRFNVARKTATQAADDPATRHYLAEYFAPHNQRLGEVLGRDFDWPSS